MTLFLISQDFGKLGIECIGHPETTRRDLIAQIASGEFELNCRFQVFELEPIAKGQVTASYRDVTEDIARDVRDLIVSEQQEYGWDMANWIHGQLGVRAIRWGVELERV